MWRILTTKVFFLLFFRDRVLIKWKTKLSVITRIYEANRKLWTIISEWSKYNYSCFGFTPKVSSSILQYALSNCNCPFSGVVSKFICIYMNIGQRRKVATISELLTDQLWDARVKPKLMRRKIIFYYIIQGRNVPNINEGILKSFDWRQHPLVSPESGSVSLYRDSWCRQEFHQLRWLEGLAGVGVRNIQHWLKTSQFVAFKPISTLCNEDTSILEFPGWLPVLCSLTG